MPSSAFFISHPMIIAGKLILTVRGAKNTVLKILTRRFEDLKLHKGQGATHYNPQVGLSFSIVRLSQPSFSLSLSLFLFLSLSRCIRNRVCVGVRWVAFRCVVGNYSQSHIRLYRVLYICDIQLPSREASRAHTHI